MPHGLEVLGKCQVLKLGGRDQSYWLPDSRVQLVRPSLEWLVEDVYVANGGIFTPVGSAGDRSYEVASLMAHSHVDDRVSKEGLHFLTPKHLYVRFGEPTDIRPVWMLKFNPMYCAWQVIFEVVDCGAAAGGNNLQCWTLPQ